MDAKSKIFQINERKALAYTGLIGGGCEPESHCGRGRQSLWDRERERRLRVSPETWIRE